MGLDIGKRLLDLQTELGKSMGTIDSEPPPGETFKGMTLGDRMEWEDHFADVEQNAYHGPRRLMGVIVHMHLGQWGWGLRVRLLEAPEGDPLKAGATVFRWGDTISYSGKPQRVLQ